MLGFLWKGILILKPMSCEHVIWGVKLQRPILLPNVEEYLKKLQKVNLAQNQVKLTMRDDLSQRNKGSPYFLMRCKRKC